MSIREELLALQLEAGGVLQVEPTVEWARQHPSSALHKSLEWDNAAAGHEWRCHQIRQLIAIHVVSVIGERQLVSLTIDRKEPGGGYRSLTDVLAVPDLREVLLRDALAELQRVQMRYQTLVELSAVWEAVEKVRREQASRKQKEENHSAA